MAHRMIDSLLFSKKWFRGLLSKWKLLWLYIHIKAENDGTWIEDLETASFQLGEEYGLDEFKSIFKARMINLGDDEYFFPDYLVNNHKNQLKESDIALKKVIPRLLSYGLIEESGTTTGKNDKPVKYYSISKKKNAKIP